MSLKPLDPKHLAPDNDDDLDMDLDLGGGARISNDARSMNHYGVSPQHRRPDSTIPPDATGGFRVYASSHAAEPPKDRKKTALVVAIVVVVVAALAVGAVFGVRALLDGGEPAQELTGSATVTIPNGYGTGDIAQLLRENGVIASTTEFVQAVSQRDAGNALRAGTYTFERGSDLDGIIDMLVAGPEASGVSLTIPEGYTVQQTAQRVEEVLGIPADEFVAQAKASNYVGEFTFLANAANDSLEGFLYPLTYSFAAGATADDVIRTMLQQFQSATAGLDWNTAVLADGTVLNQYQVVVLASLIERETAVSEERPLVASVIINRLNAGMPIQIDAVIAYVLNKSDLITYDDLANVAANYPEWDVYNNPGLPPQPICSPSLESIQAALNAAQTDYLYYVASPELDGTHVFCTTDEEFATARDAYNQAAGITG